MNDKKNKVYLILGILYCLLFGYLLFAAPFRKDTYTEVNLIPFKILFEEIKLVFTTPPSTEYIVYTLGAFFGNLFLLIPIPLLFKLKLRQWKLWGFVILVPLSLELLQYIFQVGSADVDDVVLNATGAYFGAVIARKR